MLTKETSSSITCRRWISECFLEAIVKENLNNNLRVGHQLAVHTLYALSYVLSSAVLSPVEGSLVSYVYTKCFFINGMWFSIADDAYERIATIAAMNGIENRGSKVSVRR